MRKWLRLAIVLGATAPHAALGWDNLEAHPELTKSAALRDERIASYLREVYGLSQGLNAELAVQIGFDDRTDPDINKGGPVGSSRFAQSWDSSPPPSFPVPRVDSQIVLNAACRLPSCLDDLLRESVLTLLRSGSFGEDNPNLRASHHFYDPVKTHDQPNITIAGQSVPPGNRGLDNTQPGVAGEIQTVALSFFAEFFRGGGNFSGFGRSARDRALDTPVENPASSAEPENFFALPDAERFLFESISAASHGAREHFLALHFLAVGSVLHLLQDMSSVAHTRNDFLADHLRGEIVGFLGIDEGTLEGAGKSRPVIEFIKGLNDPSTDILSASPAIALANLDPIRFAGLYESRFPFFDPSGAAFQDFWDSPSRLGLAEFTNAHFFSRATVDDRYVEGNPEATSETGYPSPRVAGCQLGAEAGTGSARTFVTLLPRRDLDTGRFLGPESEIPFLSSETVPHLARCGWHAAETPIVIDDSVMRDYLEMLLPLAVDYSAKFLERYFAPRIAVRAVGERQFRVENVSDLPIRIRASELRAVYDDDDGNRWSLDLDCGDGATVFEIAPGETSSATCTLPISLPSGNEPPAVSADFWVVARGAHGERGSADPSEFETAGFVTFVAHVQPQLLVHGAIQNEAFTDDDPRYPIDIFSIPLDLGHEAAENDVPPTRTNLTAALRASVGSATLDLTSPNGEPHGVRIALRSDKDATETDGFYLDVAAPQKAYLFDPTAPPTSADALTPLPESQIHLPNGRPHIAPLFSGDGAAIFYYEDASFASQADRNAKDALLRYRIEDAQHQRFTDRIAFATSNPDETPDDLNLGDQRDVCRGLDDVSARLESVIAGQVRCYAEVVIQQNGNKIWSQTGPSRTEIRVATVTPSIAEPGKLEAQYTERIDLGAGAVFACGGSPNQCWQRGGEPSGEENAREEDVAWSPDGTRIAFLRTPTSNPLEFEQEIWVADLVTREVRRVMTSERGDPGVPQWSPDGKWLVFGMRVGAQVTSTPSGLIVENADDIDVYAIRSDGASSQPPQRLTRGLRPFSIGIYAPLLLPSAP